ncbi:MAG: hypothetical protein GY934_05450, partial [Gammaproteobacteria bacterium]|nr:hypothetical protein [Gammaproteobacteria bacterium]
DAERALTLYNSGETMRITIAAARMAGKAKRADALERQLDKREAELLMLGILGIR